MINTKQVLVKRPVGLPTADCWELQEETLPALEDGQLLIEQQYISLDPAMRGWMNDSRSYIPPIPIGDVMRAGSVGKVIDAKGNTMYVNGSVRND